MKKIYISGKISGIEVQAKLIFAEAEKELISLGYEVVNPMKLNHDHDKSWEAYMKVDLIEMMKCDSVYFLTNWEESRGACLEHVLALELKMEMLFQESKK